MYAFAANAGSRFADSIEKIADAQPDAVVVEGVSISQNEMETAKEMVLQRVRELTADNSKPENAGIFTANGKENHSKEKWNELYRFGRSL